MVCANRMAETNKNDTCITNVGTRIRVHIAARGVRIRFQASGTGGQIDLYK
jgi:hypothetical protein